MLTQRLFTVQDWDGCYETTVCVEEADGYPYYSKTYTRPPTTRDFSHNGDDNGFRLKPEALERVLRQFDADYRAAPIAFKPYKGNFSC